MPTKLLSSVVGRVLIICFAFKTLIILQSEAGALRHADDRFCTPEGFKEYLIESPNKDDIELLYKHCRDQFLRANTVSASVKTTVDGWIGTDLSKAETNQIFLIYDLLLSAPKPANVSEEFENDCNKMEASFQTYRDNIEPLTNHMDIDLDSLLMNGIDEVDDQERALFDYVQYTQFCRSILDEDDE